MTLPHGFGSNMRKCNQYNCDGYISNNAGYCDNPSCARYKDHGIPLRWRLSQFKRNHGETIVILSAIMLFVSLIAFMIWVFDAQHEDFKVMLTNTSCPDLRTLLEVTDYPVATLNEINGRCA